MRALILVDIQNDFMPDGALPVPNGYDVIPVANELITRFDLVVATQDWHPATHESFASNHRNATAGQKIDLHGLPQILWPDHCVQQSHGAQFVESLRTADIDAVFQKGTDPQIDSYSGFFDNGRRKETQLAAFLRERDVSEVVVVGVATDYCVRWTAMDAISEGFETTVVLDGCRGVELQPGDVAQAISEMRAAGVRIVNAAAEVS